jgi:hypothetical protein
MWKGGYFGPIESGLFFLWKFPRTSILTYIKDKIGFHIFYRNVHGMKEKIPCSSWHGDTSRDFTQTFISPRNVTHIRYFSHLPVKST